MSLFKRGRIFKPLIAIPVAAMLAFGLSTSVHSTTAVAAEQSDQLQSSLPDPTAPIVVGPRELVGKPSLGEKAAASAIGSLVGSVFGGSGSKSSQPRTRRDPSRKTDYNNLAAEDFNTETQARGLWTKDGLLISSRIEESVGKGTFQALFLESCDGKRLYPQRYEIYDLWNESSLSVSWSKTSSSNGKVTRQESGGWSQDWGDGLPGTGHAGSATEIPGTWQQMGFDRAEGGVRQIGAYFNVTPESLAEMGEVGLFVHSTRPTQDPVTTAPAHWLVGPGSDQQPQVSAPVPTEPGSEPATAEPSSAWQNASAICREQNGLLLASAADLPLAAANSASDDTGSAQTGLPIPLNLKVRATGMGQTTGHILSLSLINDYDRPIEWPALSFYIPSDGKHQSYVGSTPATPVPAGSTIEIPVSGYCGDVRKPPIPAGEPAPHPSEWIVVTGPVDGISIPPRQGAPAAGRATIPGTDTPIPRAISAADEPLLIAPLLLAAMDEIKHKTTELQASGDLQTPFSGNPEREYEAVVQQTLWIYAAELEGKPYTKEEFTERLEAQYEGRSGVPITSAPQEDQDRVQQGADDFWGSFELVGLEAKVINHSEPSARAVGTPEPTEAKAAPVPGAKPPPEEIAEDGCPASEHIHHTDRQVNVQIADSYGDDASRKKITDGIKQAVESQEPAYVTTTPPSTAYALWRDDAIGGISSAYAKSVFLQKNSQEWVWSTDPLKVNAKGTGVHTLSFEPGPGCSATVAGAGLMWIKSSSEAFDVLERSIEVFRALDAVKELTVKYLADKLPPGIDEAVEAGVDAITDPASDTYAAAKGSATLLVGAVTDNGESANRVVYKRKDKEDKAIIGGGATVKKLFAADVKSNSLTSKIDAAVMMEAGATGNGFAKAYLESVYGTLLVGVCECPSGTSYKILTDAQMFIRTDAAKGAVDVALRDMQSIVDRISKDIESGDQDTDGKALKKRVEAELNRWGNSQAGERFEPKEGRTLD